MSKLQTYIPSSNFVPVEVGFSDPAYTAVHGDLIVADTTGGAFTVTLPASPEAGDRVLVVDAKQNFSTANLTIGRNGSNIDEAASDYTADGTSSTIELIYSGDATVGWVSRSEEAASGGSSPTGGTYGYAFGSNQVSTIDRVAFPFDSGTASAMGSMTPSRYTCGGCNSSQHGFIMGGAVVGSGSEASSISRITFPFDSGNADDVGKLSGVRRTGGGCNSSEHGFCLGGEPSNNTTTTIIDRFAFPHDSGNATHVGNLSAGMRVSAGFNSSSHGYSTGGQLDGAGIISTVDRIIFPFASGTASHVGNLTQATYAPSACNSSDHGFVCGGSLSSTYYSTVARMAFPFDSGTASSVGNLSNTKNYTSSFNSTEYGFTCGGSTPSVATSNIDRFTFPFASGTASAVGNLSATAFSNGLDDTDFNAQFI
jgi:hypothetical protein